jgi:pimeloyl-ACP methyl ester carboxylesterase
MFNLADFDYQFIDSAGVRTAYLEEGAGAPVLLIHGSGAGVSAAANWYATIGPLSEQLQVLAPELAGFGFSGAVEGGVYSMQGWVDQLVAFLDAKGLDRVHLVGNSLGAWVGLELALRQPDRLDRLLLMGTGGAPVAAGSLLRAHQRYQPDIDRMREQLRHFVVNPDYVTEALVQHRFEMSGRPAASDRLAGTTAAREAAREQDPLTEEKLRSVDQSTLIVHGREDRMIPAEWSWKVHHWLPNSDLHVFSHCGHWSQIERAQNFNELAASHLTTATELR